MSKLAKEVLLDRLTKIKLPRCESYLAKRATAKLFGNASRASSHLELIHSNICKAMNVKRHHRPIYFLTFINDYSCNE